MGRGNLLPIWLLLFAVGCPSEEPVNANEDGGSAPDQNLVDQLVPDQWPVRELPPKPKCTLSTLDMKCIYDSDCPDGASCVGFLSGVATYCACKCTPDNESTAAVNEDTCPGAASGKSVCVTWAPLPGNPARNVCLKGCKPRLGANDCQPDRACNPISGALVKTPYKAVCYLAACVDGSSCLLRSGQDCKPSMGNCPAGQTCQPHIMKDMGYCVVSGVCDKKSGLCAPHKLGKATAKDGDPCAGDLECGGAMKCNTTVRNGMCYTPGCLFAKTLTSAACQAGSVCNSYYPGGVCQRTCDLTKAKECRGNTKDRLGDLECRALNQVSIHGRKVTSAPVCEHGQGWSCALFKNTGLDCSEVGLKPGNATKMACRDFKGNVLKDKYDEYGVCLDSTASGPVAP